MPRSLPVTTGRPCSCARRGEKRAGVPWSGDECESAKYQDISFGMKSSWTLIGLLRDFAYGSWRYPNELSSH